MQSKKPKTLAQQLKEERAISKKLGEELFLFEKKLAESREVSRILHMTLTEIKQNQLPAPKVQTVHIVEKLKTGYAVELHEDEGGAAEYMDTAGFIENRIASVISKTLNGTIPGKAHGIEIIIREL